MEKYYIGQLSFFGISKYYIGQLSFFGISKWDFTAVAFDATSYKVYYTRICKIGNLQNLLKEDSDYFQVSKFLCQGLVEVGETSRSMLSE